MESQKYYPLVRQNILPLSLGLIGVVLLGIGLLQFFQNQPKEPALVFTEEKQEEEQIEIIVDIEGAVINPGVYNLKTSSRVVDALAAAGGLSEEADREYVEKNINLAGKISDGLKIYIPRIGEQILSENTSTDPQASGPVININTAGVKDLESLSGVGEVTAQKIIEGRPYASIEDLLTNKIIGNAVFEKIKNDIAAN